MVYTTLVEREKYNSTFFYSPTTAYIGPLRGPGLIVENELDASGRRPDISVSAANRFHIARWLRTMVSHDGHARWLRTMVSHGGYARWLRTMVTHGGFARWCASREKTQREILLLQP